MSSVDLNVCSAVCAVTCRRAWGGHAAANGRDKSKQPHKRPEIQCHGAGLTERDIL